MNFDSPPSDPIALLNLWIEDARKAGIPNPNAMTLATVDAPPDGKPSARIVLLKELDARGAVFYTNRHSRKGAALKANPRAALLFHWDPLDRQVRIEGNVTSVSDAESDAYFATRPRDSQLAAWASQQSRPVANRAELEKAFAQLEEKYTGIAIPRPPHWGGYRVSLKQIEFWQGHPHRLHDRVVYTTDGRQGWRTQRLCP